MDESTWYLRKASDGSQFGPVPFMQLKQWAADAQISPLDRVSGDEQTWLKAPMVPELEMDYLIEVGEEQYYGPTTVGAIAEFLAAGEITSDAVVTNCKDSTQVRVQDVLPPALLNPSPQGEVAISQKSSGIRSNLQQRIRELEESLMKERRARESAETIIEQLEAKLAGYAGEP
jgi:hypothetical protein